MKSVRPAAVLAALVLAASLAAPAAATPPAPLPTSPPAAGPTAADPCGRSSWLAGTTEMCDGVLIYRDYVVDDYGAGNLADPTGDEELLGSLSRTEGDQRYPDGAKAGTADLIDLSLRIVDDRLVAVFELNALYEADSTIGALAIDTDNDAETGGGKWEGLGISSTGWDVLETVSSGNVEANTLRLEMPVPSGKRWRVQAVTAQADGTVMNVAFRGIDEISGLGQSTWWEGKQAAALDAGDISEFGAEVAVADLRNGVTAEADHAAAGYHERVFTSAFTIGTGEGYSYEPEYGRHGDSGNVCEQEFATFGRYQPYNVYVPEEASPQPGLQLFLHGCNANHSSQIDGEGFQTQFGDAVDRVIVAPLGRGPVGYYSDISEADVFEAVADADAVYDFDPQRWFISGYSMGGYGAMRLAALYPDLWAGLTNWVGFTGDAGNNPTGESPTDYPSGAIGNVIDFVGNFEHIASEHLYAGADELVQSTTHTALALRLEEAGVDHGYYLHPAAEHLTFVLLDEWSKEAAASAERTLVTDPARVRYRTDLSLAYPEYGLIHDRAYWVSEITAAAGGYSDVDLTTGACGGSLPVRSSANNAGPNPVPWTSNELRTTGTTPIEQAEALTGTLDNVASLEIDVLATCFAYRAFDYRLTTDGPVTLTFSDGRTLELDAPGEHNGTVPAIGVCDNAPAATHYLDRARVRVTHLGSVDCVIHRAISVGASSAGGPRFAPLGEVTRGQMASFLVNTLRAAGLEFQLPGGAGKNPFTDLDGSVHATNIRRLAVAGIVAGRNGRFRPNEPISRAEMATFMVNTAEFAGDTQLEASGNHFADVPTTSTHWGSINAGFEAGLFGGTREPVDGEVRSGTFSPGRPVLRDQMASFLVRLLRYATARD